MAIFLEKRSFHTQIRASDYEKPSSEQRKPSSERNKPSSEHQKLLSDHREPSSERQLCLADAPWCPAANETIYTAPVLWNSPFMKIESLHIGLQVRHPQHGLGTIKALTEQTAEIQFDDGRKSIAPELTDLQPVTAAAAITGLDMPLAQLIEQTAQAVVRELGYDKPDQVIEQLGARWHAGKLVLHPSDASLQPKEVPLEVFFHKIVMLRNNLRVLEQKINGHEKLTDADKVELQQYITRSYGSLTTFNVLFKSKSDQFSGASAD